MSKMKRLVVAGAVCAAGGLGVFAQQWTGGEPVTINVGQVVNVTVPEPNIPYFRDNGTLAVEAGGSMSVTGNVFSAVGSEGAEGLMTVTGSVVQSSVATPFYVGHQGGTGTLHVAAGGVFDIQGNSLYIAGNNSNGRIPSTRGFLEVEGTVKAAAVEFTPYFPNGSSDAYVDAGVVRLLPGGVLETAVIKKNDRAYSYFHFEGGTLKMTASGGLHNQIGNGGHLYYIIEDNCEAVFDTGANNVTFNAAQAGAFVSLTGNGGLCKLGAGSLTFQLADVNNTFSGDIVVKEGSLNLNRPLEQNQQVWVHDGAVFVIFALSDLANVHIVSGGKTLFTVGGDMANLDLTALPGYYTDRLGGPGSGTATLSETLVYDSVNSGIFGNPFRLIGQGGTLVLTNTGLENAYLQLEGSGRFTFANDHLYTPANSGQFTLLDSVIYRQQGTFTMTGSPGNPAVFSLAAPLQFETAGTSNALEVAYNGDAEFYTTGATMNVERLRVAGGDGVQGSFIQRGGSVTAAAESWVGYDNGTGRLDVANGNLTVNADLRIAGSFGDPGNTRPDGTAVVSNGVLQCNTLNFTPYWYGSSDTLTNLDVGRVYIRDGGIMQVNLINKNDNGTSTMYFEGGLLRARQTQSQFVQIGQSLATLVWTAPAGKSVIIDSQNYEVSVQPGIVGKLRITGNGSFTKRGSGRFDFYASLADYLGDTIVEAGTLRMNGNNQLPAGPGYGNLVLANANATLDLNGRETSVNKISGVGWVNNLTTSRATLRVLVDGQSDTWTHSYVRENAPVTLVKQGNGTLTLSEPNTINVPIFDIQAGKVRLLEGKGGYPFYRFKIEAIKNYAGANSMQFSQLALYNGSENVTPNRINVTWDSTGGAGGDVNVNAYPSAESPDKVVNGWVVPNGGNARNKWLDWRMKRPADVDRIWIALEFATPQPLTSYNWATADDAQERDPAAWRLQYSQDGVSWSDLDTQSNFNATSSRNTWVTQDGFPVGGTGNSYPVFALNTLVCVSQGGTLEVAGEQQIGALAGTGNLYLDGVDAIIGGADTPGAFYGSISGDGNILLSGDNQHFNALNTATGDFIVRSGTTAIAMPEALHRWFRFTIQDTRAHTNTTQVSEFALYAADGTRHNLNLTKGADALSLNPGEFWSPNYALGNGTSETAASLFDNVTSTKWCPIECWANPANPSSWREVTMRLPAGDQEIMSYNLATANDIYERDPITWKVESSADGITWQLVDARTDFVPTQTRQAWYNNGIPLPFQLSPAYSDVPSATVGSTIPDDAIVEVCPGATLTIAGGKEVIGALRVDMVTGAGTITRLTPAANGTLHLANAPGGSPASWVIPIAFGSVDTPSVLGSWSIIADGIPLNGYSLYYDSIAGQLKLRPQGTVLIIK